MRKKNSIRSFTLVELMVASAILVSLLAAYLGAYKNIMTVSTYTQGMTLANAACQARLEQIMATDFDSVITAFNGTTFDINVPAGTSGFSSTTLFGRGTITIIDRPELYGGGQNPATYNADWPERDGHTSVVYDNKMWVMGGRCGAPDYNDVWWTDDTDFSDGQTWTQAKPDDENGWSKRYGHTSLVYDNKMWVMGGFDGSPFRNDVWSSTNGQIWDEVKPHNPAVGWSPRGGLTSLVYDNKMWIMGGYDSTGAYKNDVWYSTDGVIWTCATPDAGWPVRSGHTSVVYNNRMWVMGGTIGSGNCLNDVWWTDDTDFSDGQTWTQAKPDDENGWSRRRMHTSVVYDNKMWVIGGTNLIGDDSQQVWYSTDGANWIQVDGSPGDNMAAHTSVVYNNKMWVIGGSWYSFFKTVLYSSGYNKLLEVTISACWRQPDGRVFGEDLNLDGTWNPATEDVNGNGVFDPGTRIRVLLSDTKNMGNLRRTYFGRP